MSVREAINQNKGITITVVVVIILAMIFLIFRQASSTGGGFATRAYYTDDDGQTFFVDDALKVAPFDHNGKEAVKAFVYDCNGTRSVHYMERYTEVGQKAARQSLQQSGGKDLSIPENLMASGVEYKRPGESKWQPNPPGPKPCPDGKQPEWITP